jgi:hypothetical protein
MQSCITTTLLRGAEFPIIYSSIVTFPDYSFSDRGLGQKTVSLSLDQV